MNEFSRDSPFDIKAELEGELEVVGKDGTTYYVPYLPVNHNKKSGKNFPFDDTDFGNKVIEDFAGI